jgi:pSer/pThr/pTyr-binding forkhead associated (FHA) protein
MVVLWSGEVMVVKLQVVMTVPGKSPREFEYEFEEARITIGRDQSNDIQVPLSTVSRQHCTLTREGNEWYLEDLKSTHGTKHNAKPVGSGGKKLLRDGDTIELIHFVITFHTPQTVSPDYSVEKTEALARKMVDEILQQIGKEGQQVPYLRVMNGPDEGKRFDVGPDVVEAVIGRGADCDFHVNDANISRRHAIVRRDWNEITIEDAGSKNGVLLNDKKLQRPAPLRDADEVFLGSLKLTFIDPTAKIIGQLDDIPAFESPTSASRDELDEQEPELDAELDAPLDEGLDAPLDIDNLPSVGNTRAGPESKARDTQTRHPDVQQADDGGTEADPFEDDDPPPSKALGPIDIGIIAVAVVAVLSLLGFVIYIMSGS